MGRADEEAQVQSNVRGIAMTANSGHLAPGAESGRDGIISTDAGKGDGSLWL